MSKALMQIEGKIHQIQSQAQGKIQWYNNRMKRIRSIPVTDYSAQLSDRHVSFVLSACFIPSDSEVKAVAFSEAEDGSFVVSAIQHNELLYLNPFLHDRAIDLPSAFPLYWWHWGAGAGWGLVHLLDMGSTLFGTLLGSFVIIGVLCICSGYIELKAAFDERKMWRRHILNIYDLPEYLEDRIFQRKWRHQGMVGVVDLLKLKENLNQSSSWKDRISLKRK